MSDEKPLPPEQQEPSGDESPNDQTSPRDPTPVEPPDVDLHDLPTLIDLEKNAEHDDEETDDIFPVGKQNQPPSSPRTLPGSGGFDPNPDFTPTNPEGGQTVPHIVPFQHTMVHVPGEEHAPIQAPRPAQQPRPPQSPGAQHTIPAPPAQQMTQPAPYPTPQTQQPYPAQQPVPALPRRPKPKQRRILGCTPGCLAIFVGVALTFCGGLTLAVILISATLGSKLDQQLQAQVAQIDNYTNFQSTFFYDRTGKLLYEAYNEGKRTNVAYSQFPQNLINATIATEDDTFFTNPGFEIPATVRAFLQYVGLAQGSSGGSTITQQLVRDVLFPYDYRTERSIQRKAEEIVLAFLLTQRKSKQDILTLYLNEIYYGNRAYGAEAASQTFFSKDVSQLTLGEAALLAGLPQAPADLDPLNPDPQVQQAVDARWRVVLDAMLKDHFITQQQHDDALKQGITYNPSQEPLQAPHFTVYAEQELDTLLQSLQVPDTQIQAGGFKVYTTVDLDIDNMAQQVAQSQIAALKANNASNAAVVVLQPITGEILAMVGSVDYNNDAIDGRVNVAISLRQPGSAMKPLTYSAAMEQGMTPGDIIWDTPVNIDGYQPVDYDRQWHGPVRMRVALANSYNVPAVQTLRRIGVPYFLQIAQR
ncbi:MAG TPA: transglycosylase domain-containing protein, partial [Phototrophicaceae bacterium]|nr:transglycosylase domain-containing protein [Phototrophicaceae bacterium]